MTPIVIPPPPLNTRESHVLDGVELADGVIFDLVDAPVFAPAPDRRDWIGGVDSDGSVPLDEGHSDNSTLLLPLRVQTQSSADNAWNKIGVILDKLQAVRRSRDGLPHIWTPKDMTDSWQLTVRAGEITELPMASRGDTIGYLLRAPRFTLLLTCDPFLYRVDELIEYDEVASTEPVFSILLEDVPGHTDAEATITVTDDAGEARRHVEVGLGENSTAPLLVDSASGGLETSGFAGGVTTRSGAYGANGVVRATLAAQPQAICGTGELEHIGVLRPKARVWATSIDVRLRLAYRTADGTYSYTPWTAPIVEDAFCEVSFGVITISAVRAGAQRWDGRIEAYSPTTGDTLDVDTFMPLDSARWMAARAAYQDQAGVCTGLDSFSSRTSGAALGGTAAEIGGTWTTSGASTDFTAADAPAGAESMGRATTSDASVRYAICGATAYTDVDTSIDIWKDSDAPFAAALLVARWTSSSLHLVAGLSSNGVLNVTAIGAGSLSKQIATHGPTTATWLTMRLVVFASGRGRLTLSSGGSVLGAIDFSDASLATGGALASGKVGIGDKWGFAIAAARYYDNFYAAVPPAEPIAIHENRAIEFRHDSTERESADGLTWGKPKSTPGGRAFIPCAGDGGHTYRLWVKARREDIQTDADIHISDATKLKVALRPRYQLPTSP